MLMFMNMKLISRLQEFIENEERFCFMGFCCITPEYVYRMWGGSASLEDQGTSPDLDLKKEDVK